jgi:hypothetical protein
MWVLLVFDAAGELRRLADVGSKGGRMAEDFAKAVQAWGGQISQGIRGFVSGVPVGRGGDTWRMSARRTACWASALSCWTCRRATS